MTTTNSTNLIENVRRGYELGWSFTPLSGKKPVLSGWQERPRETLEEALAWAEKGNVGLRTGKPSGYDVVIDVDPGGDVAALSLPKTVAARTGRADARHFYLHTPVPIGNSIGKLGPHIDVRGDGGQVVFPGSVHPETGAEYAWVEGLEPWNVPVAALPAHIVAILQGPPRAVGGETRGTKPPEPPKPLPAPGAIDPYPAAALQREVEAVASATEGTRNHTLNRAAFSLGTLIGAGCLDRATVEASLREAAHSAGLDGHEVEATIRSGIDSGMKHPRVVEPKESPPHKTGADRDYILIPGAHTDEQGNYIEQSNATFADEVLSRLPEDVIYRKDFIPGEIIGQPGEREWVELSVDGMRILIDRNVKLGQWVKSRSTGSQVLVYKPCGKDQAGVVITRAREAPRVRNLIAIVDYPIYGPGFVRAQPGWRDGIYYDEPPDLKGIEPVRDAAAIWDALLDLFVDFPFKSDADLHNLIGLMLTPIVAPALDGNRPMHLLNAPLERTGKTKLVAEVIGGILLGRETPAMQLTDSDEERDKRIISMLLQGETLLHLDNLANYLDSAAVSSLLTAGTYSGRMLGSNRIVSLSNRLTVVASGNNVQASGEMAKRTVPIMLQPKDAHPESRTDFEHPQLPAYVRENRRRVLSCLLGMVENWLAAGKPLHKNRLGGFESWSETVGGILEVNGFTRWRTNESAWQQQVDPKGAEMEAFVEQWEKVFGESEVLPKQLRVVAQENELFGHVFAKGSDAAAGVAFGRMLNRYTDTPVGRWFIRRCGASNHVRYRLEAIV